MAASIEIHGTDRSLKVIVDGTEIRDIIAYSLEETPNAVPVLKLEIAIMGEVEVQQ